MKKFLILLATPLALLLLACTGDRSKPTVKAPAASQSGSSDPSAAADATATPSAKNDSTPLPVERTSTGYRSGTARITTPLPEGYPDPTAPGDFQIKHYPLVRRAQVTGSIAPDLGMNAAFFPLFNHIQRRDIAMTSPVEMDYRGLTSASDSTPTSWTMSFLYRSPGLAPTGKDRSVEIVDIQPVTVASVGFQGPYRVETIRQNLALLERWLSMQSEWEADGEPRALCYNGPEQTASKRWGEVQLPVRRAGREATAPINSDTAKP